jgi:autotransporter-associated beta strand protein/T5SS/PEP-CTERM-associated repeat protein
VTGGSVTNSYGYLGFDAGSVGTATVSSGTWASSGDLYVGILGTGTLNVNGGSVTNPQGYLGFNAGSVGRATVSSGTWANSGNLSVGSSGTGTLTMNGGLVVVGGNLSKNAASTINLNAGGTLQIGVGSTGGVLLDGTGSLTNNGRLIFNRSDASAYSGVLSGSGAVTKQGLGVLLLSGTNTYSGTTTVSGGILAISSTAGLPGYGIAGRWSVASGAGLTVGVNGLTNAAADTRVTTATATGNLTSGAAIGFDTTGTSTYTYANSLPVSAGSGIGLAKSGTGTLVITGSSTYTGPTVIGSGTLAIGSGGTTGWIGATSGIVLSPNGVIQFNRADNYGGFSPVISGSGGIVISRGTLALTAASSGPLTIGQSAGDAGTLNVTGGSVTNSYSYLGNNAGSVGTATVSSGTWANSGELVVGVSGTGTLNVNGGSVFNTAGFLGFLGIGTATVSSGTWANSGELAVGVFGTGTLNVTGGRVTNSAGYLGYSAGSVGTATVSSGTWANSGALSVGDSGTGTLNVTGGRVTNSTGYLGYSAGSVGTATVSSGTWANSGGLFVGDSGTGILNVNGGSVSNTDGYLGFNAGSVGTATVSSGTWANSAALTVGFSGTGTLNVTGGSVTNSYGYLGFDAGSVGTATVSSGTWASSGDLYVGILGTGTLTMNGGLVTVGGTLWKGGNGTINLNAGGTLQIGVGSTGGVLLGGTGSLLNNGTLVFNRSDASTYSGVISGTGAVTKQGTGTLTLSGSSSYTGGTTLNAGSLVADHLHAFGSGAVLVNSGTLNLASHALANAITNLGGTIINAANYGGTQSVAGVVSMTGTVGGTVNVAAAGELKGSGVVFNGLVSLETGAQHSPGNSPGTQTFTSGLSYSAGSILNWELIANSGTGAGTNYDFLSVTGGSLVIESGAILDLVFSGSDSTVSWSNPFWDADRTWTIIDALAATSSTGEFTLGTISNDSLGQSLLSVRPDAAFSVGREGNNAVLTFTAVPEPSTYAMALACIAWAGWGAWRRSGQKRGGRSSIAVMMVPMAFAFGCSGAEGEILSFRVSGSMTTDSSSGGWSAGDPFTATYSFDNLAMGVYDSNIPATFYGASVKSFVFDVAGKNYSMASNANGSISVGNDGFAGSDRYIVTGDTIQHPALADGLTVSFIQFDLIDWTGMALANESLVTSAAVLQGFSSKSGRFRLSNNDQPFFNISSITAVPEPSTWLMGLAGIACGGFSMWRRRKHQRVGRPFLTTASLALIAVCLTSSLAHAAVITFGNTGIDSLFTAGSRTEAGYSYQAFGTEWELTPGTLAFGNPGSALTTVFNGTSPLVGDRVDIVSVTPAAQFVFGSVDWRTGYSSNNQDVVVEGFLGASVVGSISLTGDSLDYQTASGFGSAIDLLRIRVTNANGSGMLFDNLVLNPVPEPSTYCMALAGIACGGYLVRRRKRNRLSRSPIIAASLPLVAAVIVTAGLIGGIAREAVGAPMVLVNNGSQILRFDGTTGASLGNVLVDYGGGSIGGYTFGPDRNIYVTDFNGLQINRFNGSTGAFMNTFATGTLSSPYQPLFGPDGNLYLGQSTGIITKYNGSTGQYLGIFISPPVGASDFGGMTFRGNSLYVSYLGQSGSLYRYDTATGGNAQLVYGGFFSNGPRAPVFDNAGTMYVPDWQTNKIFKFSETTLALTGTITTAFGIVPMSLAFDESGALLVLSDNFSQSQINRYNPATGAFIDTLVAPGTGGMGRANSMLFIVPEPSTYAMALAGVACVGFSMWRRFREQVISCGRSWDVLTGDS